MKRLVRDISWVLSLAGLLVLLDATVTLAWQEPLTAVVGLLRRAEIDHRLQAALLTGPPRQRRVLQTLDSAAQQMAFLARLERRELRAGEAIGRIELPRLGASFDVVEGTDTASLEKGPGHYSGTALPGMGETVGIAGHRTTYLAPFRHIDELRPGDRIVLAMPYGTFTYRVQYRRIVLPSDVQVVDDVGYDRLVLSACNPLYSAAQRMIVFARLSDALPARLDAPPVPLAARLDGSLDAGNVFPSRGRIGATG